MAMAMLLVELDALPRDFPWDDLQEGTLASDNSCGVVEADGDCECEAWNLEDGEDEDTTVVRAAEIALEIIADVERVGKFRLSEEDWHVQIPKDTFLKRGR